MNVLRNLLIVSSVALFTVGAVGHAMAQGISPGAAVGMLSLGVFGPFLLMFIAMVVIFRIFGIIGGLFAMLGLLFLVPYLGLKML